MLYTKEAKLRLLNNSLIRVLTEICTTDKRFKSEPEDSKMRMFDTLIPDSKCVSVDPMILSINTTEGIMLTTFVDNNFMMLE